MGRARDDMIKQVLRDEIWRALERKSVADIDLCLAKGGDINCLNNRGYTLLESALSEANKEIALHLIDKGIAVKGKLASEPPLFTALRMDMIDVFTALLANGADQNTAYSGSPCLADAVNRNNIKAVDLLLQKNADVNAHTRDGNTALMIAILNRDNDVTAQKLIAAGADIFAVNNDDQNIFDLLDKKSKNGWTESHANQWRKRLLSAMPDQNAPVGSPPAPVDPRVKEDTESAPMPELKKKPFTPGQSPAGGAP